MLFQSPCCLQRFVRTFLYLHRTLYIVIQDRRVFLLAFGERRQQSLQEFHS